MFAALPTADLDLALTARIAVAYAAESSPDDPRLQWWDSDLASEFGGIDLFQRLYPTSWRWAVLRALLAAAHGIDGAIRKPLMDRDRLLTLFYFGPALDERLDERLDELQALHPDPRDALPLLRTLAPLDRSWDPPAFEAFIANDATEPYESTSIGRRLRHPPTSLRQLTTALLAALTPLPTGPNGYPCPYVLAAP